MKKFLITLFILFLTIDLSACGKKQTGIMQAVVDTKVIQEEQIQETLNSTGRILAVFHVDVVARIDGYLQAKFFNEGAMVKKGDLLYQIEPYTYAAKVSEASANLRNSQAALKDSAKNLYRAEQLVKEDFISKAEYDDRLALRDKDRASVDSNRAALRQAQINYGYTKIYSPIDGKIGKMYITEGNYVTPSSGSLVTIVSMEPILVDFPLKSKDYLALKKASKVDDLSDISVQITLSDDTIYSEKGTIDFINNTIDETTGTVTVRAKFHNKEKILVPGDYVSVKITLENPENVILVPQEAVLESADGKYLYTIDEKNIARKKMIEVGNDYRGNWIIKSGVQPGDVVATSGLQYIQPDQEVLMKSEIKNDASNKSKKTSFFKKVLRKIKNKIKSIIGR